MILDRIRALCAERGVTIQKLEQATGLSNGSISKWDASVPRVTSLKAVADFFGTTVDDLIRDDK